MADANLPPDDANLPPDDANLPTDGLVDTTPDASTNKRKTPTPNVTDNLNVARALVLNNEDTPRKKRNLKENWVKPADKSLHSPEMLEKKNLVISFTSTPSTQSHQKRAGFLLNAMTTTTKMPFVLRITPHPKLKNTEFF